MPGSASDIAGAVFFDPITRRIPKIHLDTKHLAGQIYIHLRSVIENGGGRTTPYKEAASIWIVDPDAPDALGDPPHNVTVLYAPWLIACSKKGCFLGPEEEDWCGFRVPLTEFSPPSLSYPELEPTPVPKPKPFHVRNPILLPSEQPVNRSQNTEHTIGAWSSSDVNEFFKYPSNVPPVRAWQVALSGCPSPPHVHALDPLNSAGKRTYSDAELRWMADTIQWCINEYPDISLNNICAVLVRKGPHRTTEGYTSRIRRYLHWFAEKSPLLAKRVYDYNDAYVSAPIVLSDTESPPPPTVQTPTQHTRIQHSLGRAPGIEPKSTRFTAADRAAFIRFAGARPSGMEPTGMERSMDVWLRLAEMYPHHSVFSWRTWHQHWQHDLKRAVEEYRQANSTY